MSLSLGLHSEFQDRRTLSVSKGGQHQVQGVYHGGTENRGTHAFLAGWNSSQEYESFKIKATQYPWLVPFLPLSHIVMKPGILARTLKNHTVQAMQLSEL